MKLYEFGPTRSIRVRWTLQELGVPFDSVVVNLAAGEHRRPEFLRLNPAGKLPVLVDGDLVLTESVAIARYLGEKYPEKRLVPSGLRERAQLDRWLYFAATELEQPLWRIVRHTNLYPEHLRLPADVALARQDFVDMARVLDAHLGCAAETRRAGAHARRPAACRHASRGSRGGCAGRAGRGLGAARRP